MTVLNWLLTRAVTPQQVWGADLDWTTGNTSAGLRVDTETALRLSAVWACVRLLTNSVSTMPVNVYLREGDKRIEQPDPSWLANPTTNPNDTRIHHFAEVVTSLLIDGNAFVHCLPSVQQAELVTVLDPKKVKIKNDTGVLYETRERTYSPAEVLHIPLIVLPGTSRGLNPIEAGREGFGLGLAAEEFGSRYFSNGAVIGGLVEAPAGMSREARQNLLDSLNEQHKGVRRSHALGILTGGAKFKETSFSPRDSQMLELRKYQVEEIARLFGVPPHMIASQEPGAVGYASIEQRGIEYVQYGVQPLVTRLELAYQRLLRPNQYLKFNLSALLRGDQQSRWEAYGSALTHKVMTRDEVRIKEDLEPFGDSRGGLLETPNNNPPAGRDEAGPDISPTAERVLG